MKAIFKLDKAFSDLEKKGYFAERALACCQSCALHEVPDECENLCVFTHDQDEATLMETGSTYLTWSAPDDNPKEIIKALKDAGIKVEWNKSPAKRIKITI